MFDLQIVPSDSFSTTNRLNYQRFWQRRLLISLILGTIILFEMPVLAHHPMGGTTPQNFIQGFLSGIGHPIIGPDHFVFVIAAGLMAAMVTRGIIIPLAFVLTGLIGTGLHLLSLDLPAPETFISGSVLIFGILLALKNSPKFEIIIALAAIAGLFHGYAYGESIVGAEMTPLFAYLLGFTTIQMMVSLVAYGIGKRVLKNSPTPAISFRFAGFAICGAGAAFLSSVILG